MNKQDYTIIALYVCESCDERCVEPETEPLYECNHCGNVFNRANSDYGSHRCSCGKFASKLDDVSCPDCGRGPLREEDFFQCEVCGDIGHTYETYDEYDAHWELDHGTV